MIKNINKIETKKIYIHYLFGFLFSRLKFDNFKENDVEYNRHEIEDCFLRLINNNNYWKENIDLKSVKLRIGDTDENQNIIQYYLLINDPFLHMKSIPQKISIIKKQSITQRNNVWHKAELKRYIRLYESGLGLYRVCVKIELDKNKKDFLNVSDIISLTDAGSPISEITKPEMFKKERLEFYFKHQKINVFGLYINDITNLKEFFTNDIGKYMNGTRIGKIYEKVAWVEIDHKIVPSNNGTDEKHYFQNPYIFTCMEIPEEQFQKVSNNIKNDGLSFKKYKNNIVRKDVQDILLRRIEPGQTSTSYVEKFTESIHGNLTNMCVSSRIFLNMHIRSTLFISSDRTESVCIKESSLPAILDTIELIRMRWYAYVILNRFLDLQIEKLYEEFNILTENDSTEKETLIELGKHQENIIRIKSEILRVLELPLSYRRASATATTLYDRGEAIFDIKELQKIVMQKAQCLEQLYRSIDDVKSRIDFESIEPNLDRIFQNK